MIGKRTTIFAAIVSSSIISVAGELGPKPARGVRLKPGTPAVEVLEQAEEQRRQRKEWNKKYMDLMMKEAWKNLLRVTGQEWNVIEPRIEKITSLEYQTHTLTGKGGGDADHFHWIRPSETLYGPMEGKPRDQMPLSHRIEEELIDLLEDANSTDAQIKEEIDALQQARDNAREALSKAERELAAVLTNPRQEAIFLIMGRID